MTLKKSKRGQAIKGQAIFEYFILTAVVVTAVLFLASSTYFTSFKNSCRNAFDNGVKQISGIEENDTIGEIGGIK